MKCFFSGRYLAQPAKTRQLDACTVISEIQSPLRVIWGVIFQLFQKNDMVKKVCIRYSEKQGK